MTTEEKAKRYDDVIDKVAHFIKRHIGLGCMIHPNSSEAKELFNIFPELKENEDEKIRQFLIHEVTETSDEIMSYRNMNKKDVLAWLEKQGEHLENYDEAEKEKIDFVGDGFVECHADFLDFKEGSTYWLEYIGDDKYNVRSDNLLGKTYHITPCQLYTIFKKLTRFGKQDEQPPVAITPKFKVGDIIRLKGSDVEYLITEISDGYYRGHGWGLDIIEGDKSGNYQLVEQNPTNNIIPKAEPKFMVGDWITNGIDFTFQICSIEDNMYHRSDDYFIDIETADKTFRLWTIEDAKDGDVLCTYECDEQKILFILKGTPKKHYALSYHCYYNIMYPHFEYYSEKSCLAPNGKDVKPATKDQRDLLFQKMKEAGYEWDAEKKELKKIEQKPIFKVGDTLRKVSTGDIVTISKIDTENKEYRLTNTGLIPFEFEYLWQLVEQNSLWSEEDKRICQCLIEDQEEALDKVSNSKYGHSEIIADLEETYCERIDWLKSLKDKYTWKPSDEQMQQLHNVFNDTSAGWEDNIIESLYTDLKKLREE